MLTAFVLPATREGGGIRYLRQLIWVRNLPRYLNIVLGLTLLSGFALYGNLTAVTQGAWARTPMGITFALGGAAALLAAVIATFVAAPAVHRAIEAGNRVDAAGATPDAKDLATMENDQRRYARSMRLVSGLLLVAAGAMAVARYAQ